MNQLKKIMRDFCKDERGQGTAEYVLLLVLVVAIVMAFGKPLKEKILGQASATADKISNYDGN